MSKDCKSCRFCDPDEECFSPVIKAGVFVPILCPKCRQRNLRTWKAGYECVWCGWRSFDGGIVE